MSDKTEDSAREISQVTIEYSDGTQQTINGFIVLITENAEQGKWNVELSEEVELDRVIDFAYDAIDTFEMAKLEDQLPKKKSHLTLVKG